MAELLCTGREEGWEWRDWGTTAGELSARRDARLTASRCPCPGRSVGASDECAVGISLVYARRDGRRERRAEGTYLVTEGPARSGSEGETRGYGTGRHVFIYRQVRIQKVVAKFVADHVLAERKRRLRDDLHDQVYDGDLVRRVVDRVR
jgi:hypothetical protein